MNSSTPTVDHPADGEQRPSPPRHRIWLAVMGVLALLAGGTLGRLGIQYANGTLGPHEFNGLVVESTEPPPNFTLTDHTGQPVSLYDFRGQVVMLFFGYTYCPDVCPATMSELQQVKETAVDADDVQIVMITVDPDRDTPQQLAEYLGYFDESFIGLTGTEEELLAATTPLGVFYERHDGTAASGYLVDHTAAVMVIDRQGYLRLVYPFGVTGDEMTPDINYLLRRS